MTFVFKDAQIVRNQIETLKSLYPEIAEDADLLADTIEGQTDFEQIVSRLLDFVREAETMASAVKSRKDEIAERQKRFERQKDAGRKIIQQLMEAAQQTKITLPEATITLTAPRAKVEISDLQALPQGFFKTERTALSKEIMASLQAGETVPGAEIVFGEPGLMVRTK